MKITENWVSISHGVGAPFGTIGSGYGMIGRYGFVMPNFDSYPCQGKYDPFTILEHYDYLELHGKDRFNFLELSITVDGKKYYFQQELLGQTDGMAADSVTSHALLPFSHHVATFGEAGFHVELLLWTPLIPHELQISTTPAACMQIRVHNHRAVPVDYTLAFALREDTPAQAVSFENGTRHACVTVEPGAAGQVSAAYAWYYPHFVSPSKMLPDDFTRYYTLQFDCAEAAMRYALANMDGWKERIQNWQDSLEVPAPFKRLWFSSLSSVMTSTMLSTEPRFIEIEVPHPFVNTMDVGAYSSWIYLINWPELEKIDMYQYREAMPKSGEDRGLVWHSLWDDKCDYVEEPCFISRIYRDYLWYNDRDFLNDMVEPIAMAFERVYGQKAYESLIDAKHGNQSYDVWKMPGICAYINLMWLYALHAVDRINGLTGAHITYQGLTAPEILETAEKNFIKYLWDEEKGYFHCFHRTEGAREICVPESVFSDHLFGRWLLLIEKDQRPILPGEMVRRSLLYVYKNNLVDDPENDFKGWANGMLPDGVPCIETRMYHAMTCWLSAQFDLASLLGDLGYEDEMLDVLYSLEHSLHNNHLAMGEWNRSVNAEGKSVPLPHEIAKETPRFPSIPRHKSCWELLIRLMGLKLDETTIELKPMRSLDLAIRNIRLAGCDLTVEVEKNWSAIYVDGVLCERACFDRGGAHTIQFRA